MRDCEGPWDPMRLTTNHTPVDDNVASVKMREHQNQQTYNPPDIHTALRSVWRTPYSVCDPRFRGSGLPVARAIPPLITVPLSTIRHRYPIGAEPSGKSFVFTVTYRNQ
ncbi:hypothetical protein AB1N83_013272 [Pleurotus pulmonarius]